MSSTAFQPFSSALGSIKEEEEGDALGRTGFAGAHVLEGIADSSDASDSSSDSDNLPGNYRVKMRESGEILENENRKKFSDIFAENLPFNEGYFNEEDVASTSRARRSSFFVRPNESMRFFGNQ